jgi:type II secretory pathway pseudopilin PulG
MDIYKKLNKKTQRGDTLIDVLIAMILFSIIAVALAYNLSISMKEQAQNDAQKDAILQMRTLLAVKGVSSLCSSTSGVNVLLKNGVSLAVSASCTTTSVTVVKGTISSLTTSIQNITLSVKSTQYFGSPGTITITG